MDATLIHPVPRDSFLPRADHTWKPIIVMICPNGIRYRTRFRAILYKMQRDARLMYAINLETLDMIIEDNADDIAGFVVTNTDVMEPEQEALSLRLATLVEIPDREWSVIFAFDFPWQAARGPLQFGRYMEEFFGLEWKISGKTQSKVKLELREDTLRKMGPRSYRWEYEVRGVFLRRVKQADKLLVAREEFEPGGQPEHDWIDWYLRPEFETETTEEDAEHESINGEQMRDAMVDGCGDTKYTRDSEWEEDHEDGYCYWDDNGDRDWHDDEYDADDEDQEMEDNDNQSPVYQATTATIKDSDDELNYYSDEYTLPSDWVPSDDEGTEADKQVSDCPVAIHEVKTWNEKNDEENMVKGYIGFVGHVEDNRSMSSLILGMCAIESFALHKATPVDH